jgi:GNAT superfamily N-acetyltransferase
MMGWLRKYYQPRCSQLSEDEISKTVVGCALLLGTRSLFYVKDVMVHPDWQHKQVGTNMLKKLTDWLDENAPENAFVTCNHPENLALSISSLILHLYSECIGEFNQIVRPNHKLLT